MVLLPVPPSSFWQLQHSGIPLLNSRHLACASEKPFLHQLPLAALPNPGIGRAKHMGTAREGDREESTGDIYEADVEVGSTGTSQAALPG